MTQPLPPENSEDARRFAPATQRNRDPILAVLKAVLPATGTILEVSSGTGEHAAYFAPQLAPRQWLPSDPDPSACASIAAWQAHYPAPNLHLPLPLDAREPLWSVEIMGSVVPGLDLAAHPIGAIACINLLHIAPWSAGLGLMAGAQRILPPGGILYLYGPFHRDGQPTSLGNAEFDQNLRSQNPEWGIRDLHTVVTAAEAHNLHWCDTVAMPANNLSVIFQKSG